MMKGGLCDSLLLGGRVYWGIHKDLPFFVFSRLALESILAISLHCLDPVLWVSGSFEMGGGVEG